MKNLLLGCQVGLSDFIRSLHGIDPDVEPAVERQPLEPREELAHDSVDLLVVGDLSKVDLNVVFSNEAHSRLG